MKQMEPAAEFPLRRLLLVSGVTGLFMVITASLSFWALTVQSEARARSAAVEGQVDRVVFEDELLTDYATLAALTNDRMWLTRFDDGNARLTAAFDALIQTVDDPRVRAELEQVQDRSVRLRALDQSALALRTAGRPDAAQSLLASDEYIAEKIAYDAGVGEALAEFRAAIDRQQARADTLVRISWVFRILTFATIVLTVVLVVRTLRAWAQRETSRLAGQLAEAEEWMGTAVERSSQGFGVIEPAHAAFKSVNRRLAELLAKSPDELLQPGAVADALSAEGKESLDALHKGRIEDCQIEHVYERGGESRWLRWRLTALSGDGRSESVLADVTDVTARKQREERLRQELLEDKNFAELVAAIDDGRLVLYRQPVIEISTGATTSFELLIRMDDGNGRLKPPGTFLPVAERRGLSLMIDLWVIRQAAELAARGMPVSVNISGASVGQPELLAGIREALAQSGIDPALLIFEITETAMVNDEAEGEALAKAIAELGASVALDDFGAGHSGFSYLRHFPVKWIKIDMEFVRQATTSRRDRAVISAIVGLATPFGAKTIAEGIEDQETLILVESLGVTHVQGFHLGRPAPIPGAARGESIGMKSPSDMGSLGGPMRRPPADSEAAGKQ